MREAWSDQKERKARKEQRREKKNRKGAAEWDRKFGDGLEEVGPVEAFRRSQRGGDGADDEGGKMEVEYMSLKKELKAEKEARKADKGARTGAGMFEDLD